MANRTICAVTALLAAGAALAPAAHATVIFSDDFNSYAYQLDWVPPAVWTAPGPGTVDLIGETTSGTAFDFYPGNGGYVDLDGSNNSPGTIQTIMSFAPGTYTLSFDLGGNDRGDIAKTTEIVLGVGDFSTEITLDSGSPLQLYTFTFTTTGGQLSFSDFAGGNQNIGNILDNVVVSSVPEVSSWVMMLIGFAGLGFAGYRRTKNAEARFLAA